MKSVSISFTWRRNDQMAQSLSQYRSRAKVWRRAASAAASEKSRYYLAGAAKQRPCVWPGDKLRYRKTNEYRPLSWQAHLLHRLCLFRKIEFDLRTRLRENLTGISQSVSCFDSDISRGFATWQKWYVGTAYKHREKISARIIDTRLYILKADEAKHCRIFKIK